MDTNFAAITIFTLLFAVTTARISFDPTPTNLHVAHTDFHRQPKCVVQDSDLQFVHSLTRKPGSDETLKSDKDRGVKIDLTPRSDLARFHAINRYFSENEPRVPIRSVHTRPNLYFQSSFVKPESKVTHGNDATTTEMAQRQASSKLLKFKHDYRHERYQHQHHQYQHRHQHQHQHQHIDKDSNDASLPKHKFVGEKINTLVHQHKAKTRAPEASFMTGIRKFLKHSFD